MSNDAHGTTPAKRKPSLRGGLMFDIVNGKIRARKWPRGRGKTKTKAEKQRQDWFANVQRASKYLAPQMLTDIENAVAGTPLLPRDIVTMMMANRMYCFDLPNGRTLFPMPAKISVSQSLDAIGNTPDTVLLRGETHWNAVPKSEVGSTGEWQFVGEDVADGSSFELKVLDIPPYRQMMWLYWNSTTTVSTFRFAQVSVNNGAAWYDSGASYCDIDQDGTVDFWGYLQRTTVQQSNHRTMGGIMNGPGVASTPQINMPFSQALPMIFVGSPLCPNALRVVITSGFIATGSLTVWIR